MKSKLSSVFFSVFSNIDNLYTFNKENNEIWDSVNHLNLIFEIETAFEIEIEPEEMSGIFDFNSALQIITDKLNTN